MIGSEKSHHPLNQLDAKQEKKNHDQVIRDFPWFTFSALHFVFSLADDDVNLCSDWSLGLLWSWFFDTQLKTALLKGFIFHEGGERKRFPIYQR